MGRAGVAAQESGTGAGGVCGTGWPGWRRRDRDRPAVAGKLTGPSFVILGFLGQTECAQPGSLDGLRLARGVCCSGGLRSSKTPQLRHSRSVTRKKYITEILKFYRARSNYRARKYSGRKHHKSTAMIATTHIQMEIFEGFCACCEISLCSALEFCGRRRHIRVAAFVLPIVSHVTEPA